MPGSRSVVLLALASILVLMLGAAAWCGGPVTAMAPGVGQQPGMPPGWGTGGEAAAGSFQVNGSIGSASVNGSNGASPWADFSDLGMKSAAAWGAGVRFEPRLSCLDFGINGSVLYTQFKGSNNSITGVPGSTLLLAGTSVDTTLDLTLWSVTGDLYLSSLLGRCPALRIGPRLGWTQYIDRFEIENTTTGLNESRHRSIAMFTVGLVGEVDLLSLSGASLGFTSPFGTVRPVLSASASIGDGRDMRYYNWEIWVGIFGTARAADTQCGSMSALSLRMPALSVEVGWVRYGFDQTSQREGFVPGIGEVRDANAKYRMDIPTIRAVATF